MSAIEFLSQPIWERLGLTLLHFIWQGAAVAVLALTVVHLLRLKHGASRYAAYLVAFAVMIACPIVTFAVMDTTAPVYDEVLLEPELALYEGEGLPAEFADVEMELIPSSAPATVLEPMETVDSAPTGKGIAGYMRASLPWGIALWLAGVSVLSVRLLLGFAGIRRWRRKLMPLPDDLNQRIARLGEKLGLRRALRVFGSPLAAEAMAVGYLRPMVLLPASMLTSMPVNVLEAVIAHELAHIRRQDLWVNLLQRIVETLLFYHPAVWWLSSRLRSERELCCDEIAVNATGQRLTYAAALEDAGRARAASRRPALAAGLAGQGKPLLSRVRHILGMAPSRQRYIHWLAGVLTVVVVLGLGACTLLRSATAETKEQVSVVETTISTPNPVGKVEERWQELQERNEEAATEERRKLRQREITSLRPEDFYFWQYDIRDLLVDMSPSELLNEIISTTGNENWDMAGAIEEGKVSGVPNVPAPSMTGNSLAATGRLALVRNGYLMVNHAKSIHEKVKATLEDIRAEMTKAEHGQLMVTIQFVEADAALVKRLLPPEPAPAADARADGQPSLPMRFLPKDEDVGDKLLGRAVIYARVGETAGGQVGVSVQRPGETEERTLRDLRYSIRRNRFSADGHYANLRLVISDVPTQAGKRGAQTILSGSVELPVDGSRVVLGDPEDAEDDVLILASAMILHFAEVEP